MGRAGNQSNPVASLVRTRVEPKTLFANERTFLQWCGTRAETLALCIHERWPSGCILPVCLGLHQTALLHPLVSGDDVRQVHADSRRACMLQQQIATCHSCSLAVLHCGAAP